MSTRDYLGDISHISWQRYANVGAYGDIRIHLTHKQTCESVDNSVHMCITYPQVSKALYKPF